MGAQILDIASARRGWTRRSSDCAMPPVASHWPRDIADDERPPLAAPKAAERFRFWRGASKQSYIHTIYSLFDCPDLPAANYMLVERDGAGGRKILEIGQTDKTSGSENLAKIRHRAAMLGANEVHIHYLPETEEARRLVAIDLRAGQFGTLSAAPPPTASSKTAAQ